MNNKTLCETVPKEETKVSLLQKVKKEMDIIQSLSHVAHPTEVIKDFITKVNNNNDIQKLQKDDQEKAISVLSLKEFSQGILLATSLLGHYRTFAIKLSNDLQIEYKCENPSEKTLAHNVAMNFTRTIAIQEKISDYLRLGTVSDVGVKYLDFLSKELDRANRHYLSSLQALKSIKQQPMNINIRTQTAVVGQNQLVHSNNNNDKTI